MLKKFQSFLREEEGATAVEYGLILGIIALVIIGAFGGARDALGNIFRQVVSALGA